MERRKENVTHAPQPGMRLFEHIFVGRERDAVLEILSNGLRAVLENATRLTNDVSVLVDARRYASAAFLLATADEEMAKSYILFDACRLDFSRHQSVLKRLCQAFYNHVAKHAYNEIVRSPINAYDMKQVKEWWEVEVTKWWPADPESGEPDMPHDVYFLREMPLYVEFNNPGQKEWATPRDDDMKDIFEDFLGSNLLKKSWKALGDLQEAYDVGLYTRRCLWILNETFRDHYVKETSETHDILRLYENAANWIESETGIAMQTFSQSALKQWPLYHFV